MGLCVVFSDMCIGIGVLFDINAYTGTLAFGPSLRV